MDAALSTVKYTVLSSARWILLPVHYDGESTTQRTHNALRKDLRMHARPDAYQNKINNVVQHTVPAPPSTERTTHLSSA